MSYLNLQYRAYEQQSCRHCAQHEDLQPAMGSLSATEHCQASTSMQSPRRASASHLAASKHAKLLQVLSTRLQQGVVALQVEQTAMDAKAQDHGLPAAESTFLAPINVAHAGTPRATPAKLTPPPSPAHSTYTSITTPASTSRWVHPGSSIPVRKGPACMHAPQLIDITGIICWQGRRQGGGVCRGAAAAAAGRTCAGAARRERQAGRMRARAAGEGGQGGRARAGAKLCMQGWPVLMQGLQKRSRSLHHIKECLMRRRAGRSRSARGGSGRSRTLPARCF